jgi:hypothetical protein
MGTVQPIVGGTQSSVVDSGGVVFAAAVQQGGAQSRSLL